MESILSQINRSNFRERSGKVYITKLLFVFLTNLKDLSKFRLIIIDGKEFIEVGSMPSYLREEYGLFRVTSPRTFRNRPDAEKELEPYNSAAEMENSVLNAIESWEDVKHEFVDYFIDLEIIKEKSVTLKLLNLLDFNKCDIKYLRHIQSAIIKHNVSCELKISNWQEFYQKYQWFVKTGHIRALIQPYRHPQY